MCSARCSTSGGRETWLCLSRVVSGRRKPTGRQTVQSLGSTLVLDDWPVTLVLAGTGIRHRTALDKVSVEAGGVSLPVEYAGPSDVNFPGLDQVQVRVSPAIKGTRIESVRLVVDGIASNPLTVDIQ